MIEINLAKLEKEIEAFKDDIQKRNNTIFDFDNENSFIDSLKDYSSVEKKSAKKVQIHPAIRLAYNDAKRTMSNIDQKDRDYALAKIETALHEYYNPANSAPTSENEFDGKHKELCEKWCIEFPDSEIGTYGKAQKIINMSFKYLFCCKDADKYKAYFTFCHMPLDSFTLEWFKRDVNIREWFENEEKDKTKPRIISEKMASWSALEYDEEEDLLKDAVGYYLKDGKKKFYSYRFYLENIRKHIDKNKYQKDSGDVLSPLELEFIVWPEIQKHIAAEAFLFGLEVNLSSKSKNDIRGLSLDEKYDRIMKVLQEKRC